MELTKEILLEALASKNSDVYKAALARIGSDLFGPNELIGYDEIISNFENGKKFIAIRKAVLQNIVECAYSNIDLQQLSEENWKKLFHLVHLSEQFAGFGKFIIRNNKLCNDFVIGNERLCNLYLESIENRDFTLIMEKAYIVGILIALNSKHNNEEFASIALKKFELYSNGIVIDVIIESLWLISFADIAKSESLLCLWKRTVIKTCPAWKAISLEHMLIHMRNLSEPEKLEYHDFILSLVENFYHSNDRNPDKARFFNAVWDNRGSMSYKTLLAISNEACKHRDSYNLLSSLPSMLRYKNMDDYLPIMRSGIKVLKISRMLEICQDVIRIRSYAERYKKSYFNAAKELLEQDFASPLRAVEDYIDDVFSFLVMVKGFVLDKDVDALIYLASKGNEAFLFKAACIKGQEMLFSYIEGSKVIYDCILAYDMPEYQIKYLLPFIKEMAKDKNYCKAIYDKDWLKHSQIKEATKDVKFFEELEAEKQEREKKWQEEKLFAQKINRQRQKEKNREAELLDLLKI